MIGLAKVVAAIRVAFEAVGVIFVEENAKVSCGAAMLTRPATRSG